MHSCDNASFQGTAKSRRNNEISCGRFMTGLSAARFIARMLSNTIGIMLARWMPAASGDKSWSTNWFSKINTKDKQFWLPAKIPLHSEFFTWFDKKGVRVS